MPLSYLSHSPAQTILLTMLRVLGPFGGFGHFLLCTTRLAT